MRKRERRHLNRPFPYITVRQALEKAFRTPKLQQGFRVADMMKDWADLVGESVAAHVQPSGLDKGILTLKTDSSDWRQQIIFIKPQLLDRIVSHYSHLKVRELRII